MQKTINRETWKDRGVLSVTDNLLSQILTECHSRLRIEICNYPHCLFPKNCQAKNFTGNIKHWIKLVNLKNITLTYAKLMYTIRRHGSTIWKEVQTKYLRSNWNIGKSKRQNIYLPSRGKADNIYLQYQG